MPAEGAGPSGAPQQTMRAHQRRDPLAPTIPQRSSPRYPLQIAWISEIQRPGQKSAATDEVVPLDNPQAIPSAN